MEAIMSQSYRKIGYVLFGWIALTVTATAQTTNYQDIPTGDVWITEGETSPKWYGVVDAFAAGKLEMPTGDVWMSTDAIAQTAQPSAPLQQAARAVDPARAGSSK